MTITTERRSFIQGAGLAAAAASTAALAASPAFAQTNQPSGAKTMPYQAKPPSLDPKSIKGISEKVLVSHYENNYVGAVKRLNDLLSLRSSRLSRMESACVESGNKNFCLFLLRPA